MEDKIAAARFWTRYALCGSKRPLVVNECLPTSATVAWIPHQSRPLQHHCWPNRTRRPKHEVSGYSGKATGATAVLQQQCRGLTFQTFRPQGIGSCAEKRRVGTLGYLRRGWTTAEEVIGKFYHWYGGTCWAIPVLIRSHRQTRACSWSFLGFMCFSHGSLEEHNYFYL